MRLPDGRRSTCATGRCPTASRARGALLLVHGLGEHSGRYDARRRAARRARAARCAATTTPGTARRPGRAARSRIPEALLDDLRAVFDDLADARAGRRRSCSATAWAGRSAARAATGGWVAPRGLILSSPALRLPPIAAREAALLAVARRVAPDRAFPNRLPVDKISHDPARRRRLPRRRARARPHHAADVRLPRRRRRGRPARRAALHGPDAAARGRRRPARRPARRARVRRRAARRASARCAGTTGSTTSCSTSASPTASACSPTSTPGSSATLTVESRLSTAAVASRHGREARSPGGGDPRLRRGRASTRPRSTSRCPTIADDLGGGLAGQQWVANAYLLTLASLILVSGSLADLYGERRVFTLGVAGFGVASLLCALAPTIELLVVARGAAGRLRRAAHARLAGDHRRRSSPSPSAARRSARGRPGAASATSSARCSAASSSTTPRGAGCSPSTSRSR